MVRKFEPQTLKGTYENLTQIKDINHFYRNGTACPILFSKY